MAPPDFVQFLSAFPMACWPIAALIYFASYPGWVFAPLAGAVAVASFAFAAILLGACVVVGIIATFLFVTVLLLATSARRNGR